MSKQVTIVQNSVKSILIKNSRQIKLGLAMCVHCTLCAESCFLYVNNDKDPTYMPAYKFINSIGKLYKKKGKVDESTFEEIRTLVFEKCVLCTRCYCPLGVDIPSLIALGREICRHKGFYREYDRL